MKKQPLTFRQKIAYAHWSAKTVFSFPLFFGVWVSILVAMIYVGIILYFFEPQVMQLLTYTGIHALSKTYWSRILACFIALAAGLASVYIFYFVISFFDKNESSRRFFMNFFYQNR